MRRTPAQGGSASGRVRFMYYVYILYSKKLNKFYTGYTNDLKRRFNQHNSKNLKYTSISRPWDLVYYSAFLNKHDAYQEENFLKSGKGRQRRKFLLENYIENL